MASERISQCFFSTYTSDEILKLSVKEIRNPNTFDALLHATPGGLYDSALGPHEKDDVCGTCGLGSMKCPGHFGHISLPLPVYHPLFFRVLVKILKGSCFKCHRLVIPKSRLQLVRRQLDLLDKSLITGAMDLEDLYNAALHEKARNATTKATFEIEVARIIDEAFQKALESGSDVGCCSKNATRLKHIIFKNFFLMVSQGKKYKDCPSCNAPIHDIRAEYNSRLYLKPVSRKQARKAAMQKQISKKKNEEQDQDDMDNAVETEASRDMEDENDSNDVDKFLKQQFLTPVDVRDHMLKLWDSDKELMNAVFGSICSQTRKRNGSPDMFFVHVVPVAPSRFRPVSSLGERRFENPQTVNLNKILVDCALLNHYLIQIQNKDKEEDVNIVEPLFRKKRGGNVSIAGETNEEKIQNTWLQLQSHVNIYMDSDLDKLSTDKMPGIRQILEKKEGLFRKHMMGKRVNFAARSVISPDPYINTDEIGIPEVFAKKLTYPQPVTPWNSEFLMQAIINGPKVHPGAVLVEYEDGTGVALNPNNLQQRKAIARRLLTPKLDTEVTLGCKKVHRHLINGDVLLLNRQPTLHRPSIMAHKARVLPKEKTIRLHYANCKAYNADFDGDEMNAHFPQNELARAESYGLVSTNFQYLSPRDGKPLSGLIQDHVVSGVQMTTRDVFFTREEYQQLVYDALIDKNGKISTLQPCVLKPKVLWSGKQVVSMVMINIIPEGKELLNLHGRGKVSDKNWPKDKNESPLSSTFITDRYLNESEVIIRQSELLTGILDKSQYGATPFGLVHSCFELYGGEVSGKLLSVLARLFTSFLRVRGFSLGVEDILVKPKAEQKRDKYIQLGRKCGDEAAIAGLGLESTATKDEVQCKLMEAHHTQKGFGLQLLDHAVKQKTDFFQNKINTSVIPSGLLKSFPDNALQLMIESGAKGSSVNAMQISSLLGQIELEGRRPPLMMSGRSLPSFLPYDTSARAGGFVDGRFLTGIRPQEYFFHCMAGREGLVDTAVKTSRSGYLQRCLIKHLEGLVVQYDLTVRDGDGSVVQFLYGEDGIDVCKSQFLRQDRFGFIADNFEEYNDQLTPDDSLEKINDVVASRRQNKIKRWKKKFGVPFSSPLNHQYRSPFRQFISESFNQHGSPTEKEELVKQWHKLPHHDKESIAYQCRPCLDPVLSTLSPDRYFASVSEKYNDNVETFMTTNPTGVLSEKGGHQSQKIPKKSFHPLLLLKYLRSLASPGDAVGLLASQSIGEPSTQMTLNTFHFAGRGEMNVTLGIPRLREILMTASPNIKTPTMDVLVRTGDEAFKRAKNLQRKLNRVRISDVLRKIDVSELLVVDREKKSKGTKYRHYSVRLEFLPHSVYKDEFSIKSEDILLYVESVFIKKIIAAVLKIMKIRKDSTFLHSKEDDTHKDAAGKSARGRVGESQEDVPNESDAEAELSDADENADGDATDAKSRARQTQFASYEEPEEEEVVPDYEQEDDEMELQEETLAEKVKEEALDELSNDVILTVSSSSLEKETRVNKVLASDTVIVYYDFDEKKKRWCEFTLQLPIVGSKVMLIPVIEQVAEKAVISEAKGITKAFLAPSPNPKEEGRHRIRTEGVNIEELWHHQNILDVNALYTNSIHGLAERYGIEAARRGIIKEIHDVFKVYGIYVDPRHLSLVGDYMTFEGTYRPFNRVGIETNPSPFQKMSFETTMHFLRDATAFGDVDSLGSPSSCLVVGKSVKVGTGIFQLQQPLC